MGLGFLNLPNSLGCGGACYLGFSLFLVLLLLLILLLVLILVLRPRSNQVAEAAEAQTEILKG